MNSIKDALGPWLARDTWFKSHANDESAFHLAVQSAHVNAGAFISKSEFRQAMLEVLERLQPNLPLQEYFKNRVDDLAQRAEVISSFLCDVGIRS